MNDKGKYINVADVKRKLRYIFKAYGVGGFVREKVEVMIDNLPYSVKGDLETTLEEKAEIVKHGQWIYADTVGGMRYYRCKNCTDNGNETLETLADENETKWWRFCPRCGAKMD